MARPFARTPAASLRGIRRCMLGFMSDDPRSLRFALAQQYSSIEGAMADQRAFASRDLYSEFFAATGEQQWLHAAEGPEEVADYLRLGAPINGVAKIEYGDDHVHWETPLLTALIDGREEVALELIRMGADVDAPNTILFPGGGGFGFTALHAMAQRGGNSGAAMLIGAGADVNRRTTIATTPLHFAAGKDNAELVGMLLRAGADPDLREFAHMRPGEWGDSPYDQAGPTTRIILA